MVTVREGGNQFESPEPGSYAAVCSRIIDLGTQSSEYQGKPIKRRQVIISWELAEKMTDGRPFQVSGFYTASLSEKSKLRPLLESWRGAAFSKEELDGFDLGRLLGKPCMVSLVLNDKGRIRVGSVSKLPKGMTAPALAGAPVHFDLDHFDRQTFGLLSDKLKEMIEKSPEYSLVADGKPVDLVTEEAPHEEEPSEEESFQ